MEFPSLCLTVQQAKYHKVPTHCMCNYGYILQHLEDRREARALVVLGTGDHKGRTLLYDRHIVGCDPCGRWFSIATVFS